MRFRNVTSALRLLVGAACVVLSMQSAHAQYVGEDNAVGDWQLFDEEEADSTQKPQHKEWKNLLYVRYSAAGWQGDLDMPPQPLVPYADW